ncbi:MAG: aminotransferase class I/II-fold pyridoxal phosphate-dependent enzyme [Canidatus Methanoxibalbensis ujae]|nr:aminotransferase class I/II-fold pyridoxal phosphate-dependent enzyme [Candidatus Methanoxibalbensis ujae]MCW7079044.1 aminotransferase class I/II-fold pyridoxal phosphate-dependent enzyme [Candidatus Methanoxibalbensis ujae]
MVIKMRTSMHDKISERVMRIRGSGIREFFDIAQRMSDVISLGVGEPDFTAPWSVREACIYALEKGYTSYTSNWGILELREAISDMIYKETGVYYNPENEIIVTTGVSEAADIAIRAVINAGDEVILHEPSYVSYEPCTIFAGGVPVSVRTRVEDEFRLNADALESKITDRTKVLILNYPNNPTGAIMRRKDLEEIADVVCEHDLIVISDEIYSKLTYEGKHVSIASLDEEMKNRTIMLNGLSKSHAMTGFRIGFASGSPVIIEAMMKIHQYTMLCAPTTAQIAALEALRDENSVERMVAEYNRRRRMIVSGLRDIGLDCFEPKGAFYAFPSIRSTGMTSEMFARNLLFEEHVVVVPGNVFGDSGEGFIRCAYTLSQHKIREALSRIERFIDRHCRCR